MKTMKDSNTKEDVKQNGKNAKGRGKTKYTRRSSKRNNSNTNSDSANLDVNNRDNDPNWYYLNAEIANQASSFSFDQFLGVNTPLNALTKAGVPSSHQVPLPSIMTIELNPCPGNTLSIQTGINMAALKMYTVLSSNNAKTTNYAPQDLTMLMLSLGEIISVMEHIRRTFGVAFTYNQRNRSMPKLLIQSMGFSPDDFLGNMAQHRLQYNSWVTAINKIPFLSNIAYFYKCADLYQKVYTDSESAMAQLYVFKPYSTWSLNETYDDNGSGLETKLLPTKGTWNAWASIVETMIDALFESSTFNYIYADVLNYAGKTGAKTMFLDYLVEGYQVIPEYNRNALLQIHNVHLAGRPNPLSASAAYTKNNDVASLANKNMVKYAPTFTSSAQHYTSLIVDMDTPNPTLEDRIEATRFQSVQGKVVTISGTNYAVFTALPDHYAVQLNVYIADDSVETFGSSSITTTTATGENDLELFTDITKFDWAPLFYLSDMLPDSDLDNDCVTYIQGDLNYYTTLGEDWYNKVNDLTFMALFELR